MNEFLTKRELRVLSIIHIACLTLLFVISSKPAIAQQISVTAQVDRPTVPLNQTFDLTVSVLGANNVSSPILPAIDGVPVLGSSRSSQINMGNGQTTVQTSFIYTLQPTQEGTVTIPPITVSVDGVDYTTEPIEVEITAVSGGTSNGNQPSGSIPNATSGNEVFIEAEVDNATPYLGQQITYIFGYYRTVNLSAPDYAEPSFAGFWNQEETTQAESTVQIDGVSYRLIELRTILFPTVLGEQTIDPAQLTIQQGFFQPSIRLQTNPVTVNVQPPPAPAPSEFSGAVGQFSLAVELQTESGNSAEPLTVQLDEPVTLRIILEGAGNFQTLQDIAPPDLPEWRTFDSTSSTETNVTNDQLMGRRTVEQLIVPTKPGTFEIPPIDYLYFDPITEQYETISTNLLQIVVEGEVDAAANAQPAPLTDLAANSSTGERIGVERTGVERLDADIRHIKPAPQNLTAATPFPQRPLFWALWLLPLLLIITDWILHRRQQTLAADPVAARRSQALRAAQRQLKQARSTQTDPYSSSRDILTNYLSSKLNLPVSGLTQHALAQKLSTQKIDPALIQQTQDLLTLSDMGQYAPVTQQTASTDLLTTVEQLIKNLDKALTNLEKSERSSRLLTIIIPLLLIGLLTQPLLATTNAGQHHQSSVDQMDQANQLYEAGQFTEAASIYQDLLKNNIQDSALLFNLGNAHFKQGDIGRAILNYERAARLAPRDADLRANLALARTLLTDQYDAQPDSLLAQLSQLSARWLTRTELAWIGLLLWGIVALLWVIHRRLSARKSTRHEATLYALIGSAILLIVVMGLWGIRTYIEETRGQAIILAKEINVLSGPGEQYITEFTLHSGSKVTLLESRGQWHRLSLPGDELQGWIPAEAVGVVEVTK